MEFQYIAFPSSAGGGAWTTQCHRWPRRFPPTMHCFRVCILYHIALLIRASRKASSTLSLSGASAGITCAVFKFLRHSIPAATAPTGEFHAVATLQGSFPNRQDIAVVRALTVRASGHTERGLEHHKARLETPAALSPKLSSGIASSAAPSGSLGVI